MLAPNIHVRRYKVFDILKCVAHMFARYCEQKSSQVRKHVVSFVAPLCEQDKAIMDLKKSFILTLQEQPESQKHFVTSEQLVN